VSWYVSIWLSTGRASPTDAQSILICPVQDKTRNLNRGPCPNKKRAFPPCTSLCKQTEQCPPLLTVTSLVLLFTVIKEVCFMSNTRVCQHSESSRDNRVSTLRWNGLCRLHQSCGLDGWCSTAIAISRALTSENDVTGVAGVGVIAVVSLFLCQLLVLIATEWPCPVVEPICALRHGGKKSQQARKQITTKAWN
jgi:hypothetical protein